MPGNRQDTAWRGVPDTVIVYKRDTVRLFKTDTVTQLKRDTITMVETDTVTSPGKSAFPDPVQHIAPVSKEQQDPENSNAFVQSRDPEGTAQATPLPAGDAAALQQERLEQLEAEKEDLRRRLEESEARNKELAGTLSPEKQIPQLPVLAPAGGSKNKTNLVVLPVGTGGGRKNSSEETSKAQGLLANRQDSILSRLSLVQVQLEQLQAQRTSATAKADQADTLIIADTLIQRNAGKAHTDSAKQAMDRQIRLLRKENEALQQMIGTVSNPPDKNESLDSSKARPTEHDVFFGVNQYQPDTSAARQLRAFSDTLRTSGAYWILLEGFADKSGNAAYNLRLSRKRVAAVKAVLIEQGIPRESILEKTFGSRFATGLVNSSDRKVRITQIQR